MEDELYLENIDELVTDQNRVVTYKWLSYTLGVHVNQAKQMLYDYVERKRKENSGAQLHVTYLVAGNLIQNGHTCHKVAVVKEDKLEAMKSKLSTLASVHVYSIQKAMLKDSSPLYNTDYDITKANLQNCSKFSAIHCAAAVARTAAEAPPLEAAGQLDPRPPRGTSAAAAPELNGHAPSTSSKQPSQQAKGIMGMFAKSAARSQDSHKEAQLEAKETPSASATSSKAPAKGIVLNNFFGKAALSKVSPEPEEQKEGKGVAKPPVSSLDSKSPPGALGLAKPSKKAEPAKGQQQDKKRAKKMEVSDDEEEEAENLKKKRRRIKQPESDSSDDEDVPPSPGVPEGKDSSPEPAPKPQSDPGPVEVSSGEKKRKRRRVMKSKMSLDDEGYMVTKKVYESESCTDSESEFQSKPHAAHKNPAGAAKREPKDEKKSTKKGGAAASRANKQASITGFLQRK
ncbi:DNA polymerase delta subunit 3 [Varanus komodoensis]|uniref:DNA polymerase delta subunit 3 n=1 Tax=Varanus komodoensis TaxID=61221 RepID=A0A8D2Q7G7_VARKO|nr:DNA polymerase delta subunit 3 [Varanus komodoensis]KAF7236593.1 DNA polymerase delta subunit 3 [Varanus komodoensis]